MPELRVAVMMPFGGTIQNEKDEHEKQRVRIRQRRCMLEFLRLKHIIENRIKLKLPEKKGGAQVQYKVELFQAQVGRIEAGALKLIKEADVVIGMITENNVNVVYELAIRMALRDVPIVIFKKDSSVSLPVYLAPYAHINYHAGDNEDVAKQIQKIAESPAPSVITAAGDAPTDLIEVIDGSDGTLKTALEEALTKKLLEDPPELADFIKDLIDRTVHDPKNVLEGWDNNYYPFSIVMVRWKGKTGKVGYCEDDLIGDPRVCVWNEGFLALFNLAEEAATKYSRSDEGLTMRFLTERLEELNYVDDKDLADFTNDQDFLARDIVFNEGYGKATVPIRFNSNHKDARFTNSNYLPCLIGRRPFGDAQGEHVTFLIVSYVDITAKPRPQAKGKRTRNAKT